MPRAPLTTSPAVGRRAEINDIVGGAGHGEGRGGKVEQIARPCIAAYITLTIYMKGHSEIRLAAHPSLLLRLARWQYPS